MDNFLDDDPISERNKPSHNSKSPPPTRRTLKEILDLDSKQSAQAFYNNFLKPNWEEFKELLNQHGITKLYHFTDSENLDSIKHSGGLFSHLRCRKNNIPIAKPGGSPGSLSIDERKNLNNYIHLSFVEIHPMIYIAQKDGRISKPVILEIDPELIFLKTTKYTTQNAAKNGVFSNPSFDVFKQIKFHLFKQNYLNLNDDDKSHFQAEVLVLEHIPYEKILNIKYIR